MKNIAIVGAGIVNGAAYGWLDFSKSGSFDNLGRSISSMICLTVGILFLLVLIVKVCGLKNNQMGALSADREGMIISFILALCFLTIQMFRNYYQVLA